MKVRVVGNHSFAWVEATVLWGATLEVWVRGSVPPKSPRAAFQLPLVLTPDEALNFSPQGDPWDGLIFGTILNQEDSDLMSRMFGVWQPRAILLAVPGEWGRKRLAEVMGGRFRGRGLKTRQFRVNHARMGGVTDSQWTVVYVTRHEVRGCRALMTTPSYARHLQTCLDDTLKVERRKARAFEDSPDDSELPVHAIGRMNWGQGRFSPVYDGLGRAPDLRDLGLGELHFWVRARSVFSPDTPVVRQVAYHELLMIWDYEGKQESARWNQNLRAWVLRARLASPPAKIVRGMLFKVCSMHLDQVAPRGVEVEVGAAGRTNVGRSEPVGGGSHGPCQGGSDR